MSSPSMPADHSMEVQAAQQAATDKADAQARQDAADHKTELSGLRSSASTAARGNADQYFQARGLDPTQYGSDIDSHLNTILSSINPSDENPGTYFNDFGANTYNDLTTGYQTKEQADLDRVFAPNFETTRIPFTLDDPYIAGVDAEQRGKADAIIKNMLDRGVLTATGYKAATDDLDRQEPGVKTKLNEFGTSTIAQGQQQLKDVANNARTTAGTLKLGQQFDPNTFSANADQVFNDFVNSLGDNIRAKVTGNLFNTTGLAALGGAAQGAGNTAFNPTAAAGIVDDTTTDDTGANQQDKTKESIF